MIHHLFVLDFVIIVILQKRKRQNCMKAKTIFRVLLTIICIICIHESTTANSLPLDLRIVSDSSYHDGNEHGRDRMPAHRYVIPYVDYDFHNNNNL